MSELNARLDDEVNALQKLRFTKSVTGQLENPARMRQARKEIARIKTVIREKVSAE